MNQFLVLILSIIQCKAGSCQYSTRFMLHLFTIGDMRGYPSKNTPLPITLYNAITGVLSLGSTSALPHVRSLLYGVI